MTVPIDQGDFKLRAFMEIAQMPPIPGGYIQTEIMDYLVNKGITPTGFETMTERTKTEVIKNVAVSAVKQGLLWKASRGRNVWQPGAKRARRVAVYMRTAVTEVKAPKGRLDEIANSTP